MQRAVALTGPTSRPPEERVGMLQRKCACGRHTGGGDCAECSRKKHEPAQSQNENWQFQEPEHAGDSRAASKAPRSVHAALRSQGQPLDLATRTFFEPRFRYDFSNVRIHSDLPAAQSAREVNAMAYVTGSHVVLGADVRNLAAPSDAWLMSHELAHVVQQGTEAPVPGQALTVYRGGPHESEANASAKAIRSGSPRVPGLSATTAQVMRLTPEQFTQQLGQTPEEASAVKALYANKSFLAVWEYMRACPASPKKDLGPLGLEVKPGLVMDGKERFGGFFPDGPTLKINPTKPEHKANPAELVDTVVHELIHAVSALESQCKQAGAAAAPLGGAATASAPKRKDVAGTPQEEKLMKEQGPGASNPCEEFLDINVAAQHLVVQIIKADIQASGAGRPTLTFVNEILRANPQAMAEYKSCRDVACAKTVQADKDNAIAACAANILTRYYVPPPSPSLKAPEPERPKFGPLFKPRTDFRDKILQSVDDI